MKIILLFIVSYLLFICFPVDVNCSTVEERNRAPWQQENARREASPYVDLPPNVFAPHGRLYDIEDAVHAVSSSSDPSSTSLVVIQCQDGIVAVTTLPQSPYLKYATGTSFQDTSIPPTDENSNVVSLLLLDDDHEWNKERYTTVAPFGRLQWPRISPYKESKIHPLSGSSNSTQDDILPSDSNSRIVLTVTAGNAVESQILRHHIYQTAERLRRSSASSELCSTPTWALMLARTLADQQQQRTQILGNGRILAATAVLLDCAANGAGPRLIRLDPAGQFWICQAVVAGRYARRIEQNLYDRLRKHHSGNSDETGKPRRRQVCAVLSTRTVEEALLMATECILDGITSDRTHRSNPRPVALRGISIRSQDLSVQSYSTRDLLSLVREER